MILMGSKIIEMEGWHGVGEKIWASRIIVVFVHKINISSGRTEAIKNNNSLKENVGESLK